MVRPTLLVMLRATLPGTAHWHHLRNRTGGNDSKIWSHGRHRQAVGEPQVLPSGFLASHTTPPSDT